MDIIKYQELSKEHITIRCVPYDGDNEDMTALNSVKNNGTEASPELTLHTITDTLLQRWGVCVTKGHTANTKISSWSNSSLDMIARVEFMQSASEIPYVTQIAKFMGPTWAHLGPVGPRWAPCRPHEPCYQGRFLGHDEIDRHDFP